LEAVDGEELEVAVGGRVEEVVGCGAEAFPVDDGSGAAVPPVVVLEPGGLPVGGWMVLGGGYCVGAAVLGVTSNDVDAFTSPPFWSVCDAVIGV
jgi:hypothetical protein